MKRSPHYGAPQLLIIESLWNRDHRLSRRLISVQLTGADGQTRTLRLPAPLLAMLLRGESLPSGLAAALGGGAEEDDQDDEDNEGAQQELHEGAEAAQEGQEPHDENA